MLQKAHLKNFVKFKDIQTLDFAKNESPNIFVGENGSGKSAVLEGFRRCLTSERNTTRSSVHNTEELAFFVCEYDTSKCSDPDLRKSECMFTGVIIENTKTYYKFISTSCELLIDKYHELNFFHTKDEAFADRVFKDLRKNGQSFVDTITKQRDYIVCKKNLEDIEELNKCAQQNSEVEKRLKSLEKYVAMTFPLRSIGPLQWSKSDRITDARRKDNYREASRRAEIIRYFLEKQQEFHPDPDKETEFDFDKEETIFSELIGREDIIFKLSSSSSKEERSIIVKSTETEPPGEEFALLKTPEGILEAKHFSILMSSKFQTVIFEEPDRGMHPQMVDRLLAIILKETNKKRVILTSHNTCFVNPLTIPRLFIFKRIIPKENKKKKDHTPKITKDYSMIIPGNKIGMINIPREPQNRQLTPSMKTLRTLTRDHLADLIFAKRILFCEGDSDFLFLTELKAKILKASPEISSVLSLIKNKGDIAPLRDTLQKICVSIQIISINGWENAELMHNLCENLKLEDHFFVCDKDAFIDERNSKMKNDNDWLKQSYPSYTEIKKSFNPDSWGKVREKLKNECHCFVWQDGTIEDMLISLLVSKRKKTKTEEESLEEVVRWLESSKVVNELKNLFVNLPITQWKEKQEGAKKIKIPKGDKLFLQFEVTQECIAKSTEIILQVCDNETDDLVQFISFLVNIESS